MMLYWKVAFRNLRRHWRQSLAAILSVTAGFIALVVFEGYIEQSRRMMFAEFRQKMMFGDVNIEKDDLWSVEGRSEPWNFRLNNEEQKFLSDYLTNHPDVEAWAKSLRVTGLAANGSVSAIFAAVGYDLVNGPKIRQKTWDWNVLYGVPLEQSKTPSAVLGQTLARSLGCVPNPQTLVIRSINGYPAAERPFKCDVSRIQFSSSTPSGQVSALDLEVVGFIDAGFKDLDAKFAYMSLTDAQSLANTTDVSFVSVLLKNPRHTKAFAAELTKAAHDEGLKINASDWKQHKTIGDMYRRTTGILGIFRNFVTIIILCISTLSVLNTLIKIVKERTREIGTWRSLGFTNQQITGIFACEAVALGLVGSFLGVVLALIMSLIMNASGIVYKAGLFVEPIPFSIAIVPLDYFLSVTILTAVCLGASLWATRTVLNKKISENLIYA